MTHLTRLQEALLKQGLEVVTPLAEIMTDPDILASTSGDLTWRTVADALLGLLMLGRISVWAGHWSENDPARVSDGRAEQLLADPRQYSYELESANGLDRVYYANVENIP